MVDQFHASVVLAVRPVVGTLRVERPGRAQGGPTALAIGSQIFFGVGHDYANDAPRFEHSPALHEEIRHFLGVVEVFEEMLGEYRPHRTVGERQALAAIVNAVDTWLRKKVHVDPTGPPLVP